ncbi:glutathione S-transferase T3-like [Eutrema salsugineum]|uniref:glutathione S-transferase T3-like n=1 Tax=Eutrema salsugineum TaxID=72664 RepID=UPI000CED5CC2|nr:glutathione S-transferase T3-like [Eutrema salsugineum]
MDSTDPYSNSHGFVNLLTSELVNESLSPCVDLGSSEMPLLSSQTSDDPMVTKDTKKRRERRQWSPKEDVVLISAWLNTSKDPMTGNEQKAGAFWKRIQDYFNASPQLVGLQNRELSHVKQRWDATRLL